MLFWWYNFLPNFFLQKYPATCQTSTFSPIAWSIHPSSLPKLHFHKFPRKFMQIYCRLPTYKSRRAWNVREIRCSRAATGMKCKAACKSMFRASCARLINHSGKEQVVISRKKDFIISTIRLKLKWVFLPTPCCAFSKMFFPLLWFTIRQLPSFH